MAKPPDKLIALVPPAILATRDEHGILIEVHAAARTVDGIRATLKMENGRVSAYETITYTSGAERGDLIAKVAGTDEEKAHYAQLLLDGGSMVEAALREREDALSGAPDPSQTTLLITLAADWELFHDAAGDTYASYAVESGAHHTVRLATRAARERLQYLYWRATGQGVRAQSVQDALGVLEGRARFDGPEYPVHVRVAGEGNAIYLDLGDDTWRAVRITAQGWAVVDSSDLPVRFVRARGMLPLPPPERGGTLNLLRPFLNVPQKPQLSHAWILLVAWLLATFCPRGPFPILNLQGEAGGGKSTALRVLRACIDPNAAALRSQPREERDLMIAALNSWVLAFDNMSEIKQSLSDAMCRLATGGGFACRKLYTDIDETLIDAMRPQMTDGIEEYASKQDYLDRSLLVMPQPIPEGQRKPEAELWAEFARVHPRILGALLDAVVCALRRRSAIMFERLPRMADFAIWVTAAEEALGWPQGTFLAAYTENRAQADMVALQASVIAGPVWLFARRHWLLFQKPWVGTATKLLAELEKGVDETTQAQRSRNGWPRAPHILSGALKRIAPSLHKCGLDVTFDHTKTSRLITLTYTPPSDSPSGTGADMPPWESPAPGADSDQGGQARETGLQNSVTSVTSVTDLSLEALGEASPERLKRHPHALFDAWGDADDVGDACLRDRFPHGGAAPECGQARPEPGLWWEAEL